MPYKPTGRPAGRPRKNKETAEVEEQRLTKVQKAAIFVDAFFLRMLKSDDYVLKSADLARSIDVSPHSIHKWRRKDIYKITVTRLRDTLPKYTTEEESFKIVCSKDQVVLVAFASRIVTRATEQPEPSEGTEGAKAQPDPPPKRPT
jgi:hypothetical protein